MGGPMNIINLGMIRRVNEHLMSKGTEGSERRSVHSDFLGRDIHNPVKVSADSINSAWEKVQKTTRG